jgi:FkbM family methyltransferase
MKQFEFEYPWTKNRLWWMPENEEMMQGQFPILDEQIEFVIGAIEKANGWEDGNPDHLRTVVQAGGCFGMYPIRLSHHFDNVVTFEPFEMNRRAMIANIQRMEHFEGGPLPIHVRDFALYDTNTMIKMHYPRPTDRARSNGAMQVSEERGEIPTTRLDLFEFEDLDLIWLDVEGSELRALIGAEDTIKEHRPVVVIEERQFPNMKNYSVTPRKWLEQRGYRFVGKTHADAVMVPE